MNLVDKVAVITGGSGQIGQATAYQLASQGARIFSLVRRNIDQAQALLNALPNNHLDHRALLVDVKDPDQIGLSAQTISSLAGRCDILVNSAGIAVFPPSPVVGLPNNQFDEIIATNLKGPWFMIKEFYPLLKSTGDGLVVNISSVSSIRTRSGSVFYSMTKAGVNAMTESLAKAFAPDIRVVAIAPSYLSTLMSGYPFISQEQHKEQKTNDPSYIAHLNINPLKRFCTAEDVAILIEQLATKIKLYNGHLFMLDGGTTL